jgi:hypothetical protein
MKMCCEIGAGKVAPLAEKVTICVKHYPRAELALF